MNINACLQKMCLVIMLLLIFFGVTLSLFIPYSPCGKDSLKPCRNHPSLPGSIVCENIQNIRTFVQVLRCNRMKNLQEVFLEKSYIDYLPLYILDFCGFSFLNLKTVFLDKMLEGNDMVRLQQLHLDKVTIKKPWNWEPLSVLKRLLRFAISNMVVEVLNESLLDHLTENLQSFILTSTNTTAIANNAFQKFENMIYIAVQNNEIQYLERNMFPRPSKIKYFYFGKNKITALPEDMFEDMPDLKAVSMEGNLIYEMHENTFKRIMHNLSHVLFGGNPLKCTCKMLWLTKRHTPAVFHGECHAPKAQYGKQLTDLQPVDFECF